MLRCLRPHADIRTCNSYRVSEAEVLRLNNNDLTSLDGISASCPQLVALDVTDNDISDLGHLSRLPKLEYESIVATVLPRVPER